MLINIFLRLLVHPDGLLRLITCTNPAVYLDAPAPRCTGSQLGLRIVVRQSAFGH